MRLLQLALEVQTRENEAMINDYNTLREDLQVRGRRWDDARLHCTGSGGLWQAGMPAPRTPDEAVAL